jgi:hypothetical protein
VRQSLIAALCLLLAGCGAPAPTVGPVPTALATPVVTGSVPPEPSASPGGFGCQLPISLPAGSTASTHLTDIRLAGHDGYDRIVFQFDNGAPEVELKQGLPPFTTDPAGLPLQVNGNAFLQLTFRGASRGGSDGPTTYNGPTDFDAKLAELWQVRMAGDFEGVMTFILGLVDPPCHHLFALDGPGRVVLDLAAK